MAWIYLADMVESHLPCQNGLSQSHTVKSTDTLKESYFQECQKTNCQLLQYGTTFKPSQENNLEEKSISCTVVSHAKTSVLREMVAAWKASEVDFSLNCVEWSRKYHPFSSFWKTCQPLELEVFLKSQTHLQIWGMIVDGLLYLPLKLVPTTLEKDGFYSDSRGTRKRGKKQVKRKIFPTPMTKDYRSPRNTTLKDGSPQVNANRERSPTLTDIAGGVINPKWIEWMMGVPIGWTELKPWVTEWFRSKRKQRLKS